MAVPLARDPWSLRVTSRREPVLVAEMEQRLIALGTSNLCHRCHEFAEKSSEIVPLRQTARKANSCPLTHLTQSP